MARTFGERFLEEYLRLGGVTDHWPIEALVALKKSNRRQFIEAFARVSPELAKALVIAAHTAEPETLGRRAAAARAGKIDDADIPLFLLL